jgi:hypothetical protein
VCSGLHAEIAGQLADVPAAQLASSGNNVGDRGFRDFGGGRRLDLAFPNSSFAICTFDGYDP